MVLVAPEKTGQALELMLVEDSLLDARLTIESLRRCGIHHRLSLFRDGAEAIEFLYKRGVFSLAPVPDVILLDLFLPDTDGVSFLRQLRTDGKLMHLPVVVLTSSDDGSDQRQCEELGVSSYIRKPFNEDKFLSVIRRLKGLSLSIESAVS
ncbi:response regulator [Aureliella helgolandensis]|uniref:Response regulator rcp1 n=1 Tax=Aureliella helgolandensis TaxID=2527968 RepID=A0A518G847_9BACT|nr:response regulator [Aureliella helgolandensis]QDV24753.1 Response regulator rcp1 [Aureliella helgolandensis]